jgi:putative endonuclease
VPRTYHFFVYILASDSGTLYIGVTNDLRKRVWEHKNNLYEGFTAQHGVHRLLYWEGFIDIRNAIAREKQLKGWTRERKISLFEKKNPVWSDLSKDW